MILLLTANSTNLSGPQVNCLFVPLLWSSLGKSLDTFQGSSHVNKLWYILQALAPFLLLQLVLQDRRHLCWDILSNKIVYLQISAGLLAHAQKVNRLEQTLYSTDCAVFHLCS